MNDQEITTIEQVQSFLEGTESIEFSMISKDERYTWIQKNLVKFGYLRLSKRHKGLLTRYLCKVSGYSREQMVRFIRQYRKTGRVVRSQKSTNGFQGIYTQEDVILLAKLDELHGTLSGPATKKICERAYSIFEQSEYRRLANISVAHLYNLRKSKPYQQRRRTFTKTKPKACSIGVRRKPNPQGSPGFIRIDSVHQGDLDGRKGVYHINAVDEVTQFEIVASVGNITFKTLVPILKMMLADFPFVIINFHADNGSEYINQHVAKLLNKLLIDFTKSRARHSNDNALVESKNGSIIRKHFGYAHIPQKYAPLLNEFHRRYLNPYLNYHRPCFFPETITNEKGKQKKSYPYKNMKTPYEKFKSLLNAASYLKPGTTFEQLNAIAYKISDNETARRLNKARTQLFQQINEQEAA